MAGLGWKAWTRERLSQSDLQGYIQDQVVARFASAAARTAALVSPAEGMVSYLQDRNRIDWHDGSGWQSLMPTAANLEATVAAGTPAPAGTPLTSHDWQAIVTTNASGDATVFYPAVFANGVQSLQFTVGDVTGGAAYAGGTGAALSSCTVRCYAPGGAVAASIPVRLNVRAVGW